MTEIGPFHRPSINFYCLRDLPMVTLEPSTFACIATMQITLAESAVAINVIIIMAQSD